jgi:hypothetical protein
MTTQFRNLVFEGGGVKGIAYIGAMQVLAQRDALDGILRVGGTSAGAINALIYALGYDVRAQRDILDATEFRKFMDGSFGVIRDLNRLRTEFGWYRGDFFATWLGRLVKERLGDARATFRDLKDAGSPDLHVIGTNLSTGYRRGSRVRRTTSGGSRTPRNSRSTASPAPTGRQPVMGDASTAEGGWLIAAASRMKSKRGKRVASNRPPPVADPRSWQCWQ